MFNGDVTAFAPITLTDAGLLAAAGERVYRRGPDYLPRVEGLRVRGRNITAAVRGTREYQVLLTVEQSGAVRGECSCPYSREGHFCKHCVAVGFAAMRVGPQIPEQRSGTAEALASGTAEVPASGAAEALAGGTAEALASGASGAPAGDAGAGTVPAGDAPGGGLRSWLESLSRDDLYVLLLGQLVADERWRWRLELRAAAEAADLATVRSLAGQLLDPDEAAAGTGDLAPVSYARDVRAVAAVLPQLVEAGHAAEAVAIAEHAIGQAGAAASCARDDQGLIAAAAAQLAARHAAACAAARPDPIALADFLAARALSRHEPAIADFAAYADLLGEAGIARLRERFTAARQAAGASTGGASAGGGTAGAREQRIRHQRAREQRALERLLRMTGDAGALLAIRKDQFAAAPDLSGYRLLRDAAQQAGEWPATRNWAHALLRADAKSQARVPNVPVLIDVLIEEGDLAAAWETAASARAAGTQAAGAQTPGGTVSEAQWSRLADLIAPSRPADALAVYIRQAEQLRDQAGERAYLRLARFLDRARACHRALGTENEFSAYLADLREVHKRKRKLIAILNKHQLN